MTTTSQWVTIIGIRAVDVWSPEPEATDPVRVEVVDRDTVGRLTGAESGLTVGE